MYILTLICVSVLVCLTRQRYEAETHIPRTDGETKRPAKKVYNTIPSESCCFTRQLSPQGQLNHKLTQSFCSSMHRFKAQKTVDEKTMKDKRSGLFLSSKSVVWAGVITAWRRLMSRDNHWNYGTCLKAASDVWCVWIITQSYQKNVWLRFG